MLILLMGSGFSKLIGVAVIPILTRVYSPEEYGVMAVYVSFVAILSPMLTLRYIQAIPLPKKNLAAMHLVFIAFLLIGIFSVLLFVVFGLFKKRSEEHTSELQSRGHLV